ncbi:SPOR domain-containing protein [Martelella lutilitoris]|uniref:SPOR domain-containing protein n=1 Tax=Martelella lutilitoris TaxID=2583532 RepID=A0A7T7HMX1_9HYPH|nr:SPOR domain-containing protein [Martelella lutilitoris]QQM32054.1 SPOR domain-containing protein [Martelella lutilitoris]
MADNNKPDHGKAGPAHTDADDPFAELARLIAPREAERPRAAETADDLADELLREFNAFPGHYPATDDTPEEPAMPEPAPEPRAPPLVFESFHPLDPPVREAAREPQEWTEEPIADVPDHDGMNLGEGFLEDELRQSIASLDLPGEEGQGTPPAEEEGIHPDTLFAAPSHGAEQPAAMPEDERSGSGNWAAPYRLDDEATTDTAIEQDENDLALDLDELELELADVSRPGNDGPEPLEEAGAGEAGRDDAFDPAAIVPTDEMPRPVDDLDLPRMADETEAVREPPPPVYEFDLDEELADMLASQPALVDPLSEPARDPEPAGEEVQHPQNDRVYDDDIERALEEGFLLAENRPAGAQPAYADIADESYYDSDEQERRPGWLAVTFMGYGRILLFGLAFVVIAVLAVFAGLRYLGGAGEGGPVIIAADDTSVKEAPEDPGGEVVPNQDNVIFNDASQALEAAPRQGSLIASDQEPVDVNEIAPNPLADSVADNAAGQTGGGVVEPRRVRTIIVRPDGTLVERAAPEATDTGGSAGGAGGFVAASPDDAGSLVPPETATDSGAAAPGDTDTPSVADVLNGATDVPEAEGLAGQDIAAGEAADEPAAPVEDFGIANVPIPTPRSTTGGPPATRQQAAPAAPSQPVATAAPATGAAPATSAAPSSRYAMQIASLPTEAEAQQAYRRLAAQYPAVLGRRPVEIVRADIAERGTYYRVRIPADSLSDALSLCESFKAAGGSCFVPR